MNLEQSERLIELVRQIGKQDRPGREDSVASGLHAIADALREVARAIQSKQNRNNRRHLL